MQTREAGQTEPDSNITITGLATLHPQMSELRSRNQSLGTKGATVNILAFFGISSYLCKYVFYIFLTCLPISFNTACTFSKTIAAHDVLLANRKKGALC